jgi:hypothetical protein
MLLAKVSKSSSVNVTSIFTMGPFRCVVASRELSTAMFGYRYGDAPGILLAGFGSVEVHVFSFFMYTLLLLYRKFFKLGSVVTPNSPPNKESRQHTSLSEATQGCVPTLNDSLLDPPELTKRMAMVLFVAAIWIGRVSSSGL